MSRFAAFIPFKAKAKGPVHLGMTVEIFGMIGDPDAIPDVFKPANGAD